MQILYQMDLMSRFEDSVLNEFMESLKADKETREFTSSIIRGYLKNKERIDSLIDKYIKHWRQDRLSAVDRNILRMSLYEMFYRDDIPTKVSINEAIEIGKRFSGAESGHFINGILDTLARDQGRL